MKRPGNLQSEPELEVSQPNNGHDSKAVGVEAYASSLQNVVNTLPAEYKVGSFPKLHTGLRTAMKEAFFPDDPLRQFKRQPRSKKLLLGAQTLFPVLEWGRHYSWNKFRGDLLAGLTIASLSIPLDIGYANLAHVEHQYALYTSFVTPLIYAAMGSSRDIAIGPVAVVSILLGTLVRKEINDVTSPDYYRLLFTSTFFAGVFQALLGICRLGFLVDFLSHASIVGFMGGAAIIVSLQQLKRLLEINNLSQKTDIISVMKSLRGTDDQRWNWHIILLKALFLMFLVAAKFIGKKNKRLFWVPAVAPLTSIILSTLVVFLLREDKHGVKIVNHIKKGVNPSSVDKIALSGVLLPKAVKIGFVTALIALTEAIAIGKTFAALKNYNLDGNKEMIAMGIMNVVGSLTSCYVATGSFSRSAVNYNAGCQTAVSNVVMSIMVLLTLSLLTQLFYYTPKDILAAIIISAVISLIDIKEAYLIWKTDKLDFIVCMGAFFGVVFISVQIGLLIAVSLSFAKIILHVTRPHTALLGKIPGTNIFRNIEQYPNANIVPGILVVRIDSSIYFSNANYIRDRILRWIDGEQEKCQMKPQFLVIEMSPIINIDTSGIHCLEELHKTLNKRDIQLVLANPAKTVIEKLHASNFMDEIGQQWIFLTVAEAVQTCSSRLKLDI